MNETVIIGFLSLFLVGVGPAQQDNLTHDLEEAKVLYEQGLYDQAIASLQKVILRLEQIRDSQSALSHLGEAHLHLGMAHFALDNHSATKDSFKQTLRYDPGRVLDATRYAPLVVELFEEARVEALTEEEHESPQDGFTEGAEEGKQGSKLPWIVLGAGGAATAGVIGATTGGGGSSALPDPATIPTTPFMDTVSINSTNVPQRFPPSIDSTINVSNSGRVKTTVVAFTIRRDNRDETCFVARLIHRGRNLLVARSTITFRNDPVVAKYGPTTIDLNNVEAQGEWRLHLDATCSGKGALLSWQLTLEICRELPDQAGC